MTYCKACGNAFYRSPDESWKVLCFPCWKRSKGHSVTSGNEEVLRLQVENAYLRAQLSERQNQGIPPEMLRRLIRLCHPDRQDNSEMATAATQWLLSQRSN